MTGKLSYSQRGGMMAEVGGMLDPDIFTGDAARPGVATWGAANYEFALLSAGVEISGNGYSRASRPIGSAHTARWDRSGSLCTVTTGSPHNLPAGTSIILKT